MEKLKVLELFGGIGACSKALKNLNVDYEVVDYVEIDKYAVASYNAINDTNFEPQDITTWDKDIDVDIIFHGSPCQDFSLAGKQAGGDKDSGTRSSLMYETVRIVEKLKPKYVVWENVKNMLSKKHKHNFDNYVKIMEDLGYTSYYEVLNAKDYGIPQSRERVFTISILNGDNYEFPIGEDCNNSINRKYGLYGQATRWGVYDENGLAPTITASMGMGGGHVPMIDNYSFPKEKELKIKMKDILEDDVDKSYYLSGKQLAYILDMYDVALNGGRNINNRVVNPNIAKTISCRGAADQRADVTNFVCNIPEVKVKELKDIINSGGDVEVRKLTPKECWRLMGFDDEDYERASKVNSKTQLYKQAGNSIVVNVMQSILENLLK